MPEYRLVKHRDQISLAYTDGSRGRVRIATGTADPGLAESRARQLWRARHTTTSEKLADLWPVYVADRKAVVSRTDRFDSLWNALEPHFGHRLGKAVTRDDCQAYAKARRRSGKSDSTIRTELEFLGACLRWHYPNDAPLIWMPPPSKPRENYLTKEDAARLLASIETPHVKLFVELALATGARMTALLQLSWAMIDFGTGTADLNPAGRQATNKRRTIVRLNERAIAALREAERGALTDYVIEYDGKAVKSVKKAIAAAARRSGVPCSPHVFRHTAGVWMANAGVPMDKIAQALATTVRISEKHYARFSPHYIGRCGSRDVVLAGT